MRDTNKLTFDRANELLSYDPETGILRWKVATGRVRDGDEAGTVYRHNRTSYRQIQVDGVIYQAHRLAWLLTYGEKPSDQIDHRDGDGLNNRISNLREVTNTENLRNARRRRDNSSGVTGVYWSKQNKKWKARIWVANKSLHLGYFDFLEDAAAARREAENKYGFTERHGKAEVSAPKELATPADNRSTATNRA